MHLVSFIVDGCSGVRVRVSFVMVTGYEMRHLTDWSETAGNTSCLPSRWQLATRQTLPEPLCSWQGTSKATSAATSKEGPAISGWLKEAVKRRTQP